MLVCGVEEPIQENGFLLEANEHWRLGETDYELASFTDPRLYRYSFVHLGKDSDNEDQSPADFARVLQSICSEWTVPLSAIWYGKHTPQDTGIARWKRFETEQRARAEYYASRGDLKAQQKLERPMMSTKGVTYLGKQWEEASQARLRILHSAGWNTFTNDEAFLAEKSFLPSEYRYGMLTGHLLFGIIPRIPVMSFLAIGGTPPLETFTQSVARSRVGISRGEFVPGSSMLSWLAEQSFSLAYLAHDAANRFGLVVVGTRKIDMPDLLAKGIVQRIEADYGHAWYYPPDTSKLFP